MPALSRYLSSAPDPTPPPFVPVHFLITPQLLTRGEAPSTPEGVLTNSA